MTQHHPYRAMFDLLRGIVADPESTPEKRKEALDTAESIVDSILASLEPDRERYRIMFPRRKVR